MFDGKRSTEEVLKATAGLNVTAEDVTHLVTLGLLVAVSVTPAAAPQPAPAPALAPAAGDSPTQSDQAHYLKAYAIDRGSGPARFSLQPGSGSRG